jgi:hypothetical protein
MIITSYIITRLLKLCVCSGCIGRGQNKTEAGKYFSLTNRKMEKQKRNFHFNLLFPVGIGTFLQFYENFYIFSRYEQKFNFSYLVLLDTKQLYHKTENII